MRHAEHWSLSLDYALSGCRVPRRGLLALSLVGTMGSRIGGMWGGHAPRSGHA